MYTNLRILTFGKGNFVPSQHRLAQHLSSIGIENQVHLTDQDLDAYFLARYSDILLHKKGYGYCIWKPYLILKELMTLKEGEVLLYIDSTDFPVPVFFDIVVDYFKDPRENREYLFLNRGFKHGDWTKRDTFVLMNCDTEEFHNHVQLEAGIVGLKKTKFTIKLVEEWLHHCSDSRILTEAPNVCGLPNLPSFQEHRYDQSVLTNLVVREKLPSYRLPESMLRYNFNQPSIY